MRMSARKEQLLVAGGVLAVLVLLLARSLPRTLDLVPPDTSLLTAHLLLEMFAVTIAALIFTVTWHTIDERANPGASVLIAGFLVVAVCDLMHALTYAGMPDLLGPTSTPRAVFFWLMGRTAEVLTLGAVALGGMPFLRRRTAIAAGLALAAGLVLFGSYGLAAFPATFIPGAGVTPFKAGYEATLCALNAAVALALYRRARVSGESRYLLMAASAWVIGVGELAFTSYVEPSDFLNLFGHVYKLCGYALLYWSTYIGAVRAPYEAQIASERRALESEQRIRTLSDNLPHCVVYQVVREADGSMRFLHMSEAIERIFGISVAEVLADSAVLYRQVHPDDNALLRAAADESARTLCLFDVTVRIRDRAGRQHWVQLVSAPRRLEDGRICWDGVQIDISEQYLALAREREKEALLAAVVDSASDAIIGTDHDGRISLFNPAAERIFVYPAPAMLGRPFGALLAPAPEVPLQRRLGFSRVQGRRADGAVLELEMSVSPAQVNQQQGFTVILRDVTERVRTERALVRYQIELTELTQALLAQEKATAGRLAQVLHDQLGQTLAAIRIDFVDDAVLADAGHAARHARVDRLIDQAIREVRQVLVELRPTVLDERGLYEALRNELANPRLSAAGVDIDLVAPDSLQAQRWSGDVEYAAFMVAREAIANAVRHARASQVSIVLEGGAAALRLEIRDNGRGFDAASTAVRPGHLGMIGMRERSIAIGARFEAQSQPGKGTAICLLWQEREA